MSPLSDRVVVVAILATIGVCFALVFWTVRLHPAEPSLRWRDGSTALNIGSRPAPGPAAFNL